MKIEGYKGYKDVKKKSLISVCLSLMHVIEADFHFVKWNDFGAFLYTKSKDVNVGLSEFGEYGGKNILPKWKNLCNCNLSGKRFTIQFVI